MRSHGRGLAPGRPGVRSAWGLLATAGILFLLFIQETSSSRPTPDEDSSVEAWLTSPRVFHHNQNTTTRRHTHYRDYNNHKVRHHHELRKLRRRYLENRFQPKFSHSEYQGDVKENIPVGTSILQVYATDDDLDSNGFIQYRVSDSQNFAIDSGGVLSNIKPLDFEHTNGEYRLYVYAEDQGSIREERKSAMAPILIRVRDTNEPPYFDSSQYSFAVSELSGPGSYVGTVVARDADLNFDRYELRNVEPAGTFAVDTKTGIITVDTTSFNNKWEFTFQAAAIDTTDLYSTAVVTVSIIDENTHKPVFDECEALNDVVSVTENKTAGHYVVMVKATDADHGVNGEVSYSLLNDFDSFAIETKTGSGYITTTRPLDRDGEDKDFFLTVIAKDGAPPNEALQEACTFKVTVEDINDNPPNFDKAFYDQKVATDHNKETPIMRVTATDIDTQENAEILFSIEGNPEDTSYFSIDADTGFIKLVKELDESMASVKTFNLVARATDKGAVPLSNTVPVRITVVSSGSLPPSITFRDPAGEIRIPENTPEGTDVVTICAQSNVINSPDVYFSLITGTTEDTNLDGTFDVRRLPDDDPTCSGSSRGVVIYIAARSLDYETITSYKLILQAVNSQSATTDSQILVNIDDVNDQPPLPQPDEGGTLPENTHPLLVTTFRAVDKDASPEFRRLTFSFDEKVTSNVTSKFELKKNGELWTKQPLNREEMDKYMIPLQVTDEVHVRSNIYWITVQDINDEKPVFDMVNGVYEVLLPENKEVGKNTGIVLKVMDADIVNHNDFQIVTGNEQRKFKIDSLTGEVTVASKLDYDDPVRDRNFTMLVRLSDGANQMAQTTITIAVVNVNDLPPVFDKTMYTFNVTEGKNCGQPFGTVSASDPDLPPDVDQNIGYYLSQDELTNFTIGHTSGVLSLVGCLDREAANRGQMTLYPRAMDDGGIGHDAEPTTVILEINDINDNHPYIQSPDQSYVMFMENADPKTVMPMTIQLSDWDSEVNGCPCTLAFHASTPAVILDRFDVMKVEGPHSRYALKPRVKLNREEQKFYEIPFLTTDNLGLSGIRYLTVEVGDENDSPMGPGYSAIQVYNCQGQFPTSVIGSVYVTDLDDHDVGDKVFEVDASISMEVDTYFDVDHNSGNITMQKGTPAGEYVLRVKVVDKFRNETAIGEMVITVVDLPEEALMQSGSFRVAGYTSIQVLEQQGMSTSGTSLYERLRVELGVIHNIEAANVDIFSLRDSEGGVDIRYNCHGSPYYTAARLDGLMLTYRDQLNQKLDVDISKVTLNDCLYEADSPCLNSSCQLFLHPNLSHPLVVSGDTNTMVGVAITDEYNCVCGVLEPPPSECYNDYCFNGGTCEKKNNTLVCECPSELDYGPRCELKSARFEKGYAWYGAPKVCENSSIFMSFETRDPSGLLLYSGPTVPRPWSDYPKDFLYVVLNNWVLEAYMDLGTGTISMSIPVQENTNRVFDYSITWDHMEVTFEVYNCSGVSEVEVPPECRKTEPLPGYTSPSHLFNLAAPLQLGGVAAMSSFADLKKSYSWTLTPPTVVPFYGCILELRHKDFLYDLNSTDYDKNTFKPCGAPAIAKVIMGKQSIVIIVVSLLCLIMLVLLILCLARRNKKVVSYPELDGIVKETIGGTDLEGFGEKDMTQYDLKLLRVGPDGYLFNGGDGRRLPDVTTDTLQKRAAPLAQMPEGLSIGEFINDNIKKVDKDPSDFDDVRHYCYEGDAMSIASLSSIGSGRSTDSEEPFDYQNDWGPRFEKLNEIYRRGSDEEDDSDFEFTNIPKQRKRASLPPPVTEPTPPQSPADKPPTTSRPSEAPPAPFPKPEGDKGPQRGPSEAFNPRSAFGEVEEGEESWC